MRQILIATIFLLAYFQIGTLSAQAPQKFNYQGIARDAKGNPLAMQKMSLKISVLPTQDATVSEYEETQMVTTNEFGLYTLQIGAGTPISGEMKTVKWETGNKYIKIAIDQKGGTDYVDAGTTQLLSVPYAIYADKAGLARETLEGTDKTRTGTVSSNATHVAGDANYVSKFTALNIIGKSSIYDNGNVGIGTTTPAAKLQVTGTTTTPTELRIQHTNPGGGGASRLSFKNDNLAGFVVGSDFAIMNKYAAGNTGSVAPGYPTSRLFGFNNSMGNMLFSSNGSVGFGSYNISGSPQVTVRMHIDSATGNVGIGTVTPVAKLDVAGQIKISGGTPGAGKVLTSDATGLATWETPTGGIGNAWSLNGNNITSNQFIGSTNDSDIVFKRNNINAGKLAVNNTSFGVSTLQSNTTGKYNIAVGTSALNKNSIGFELIAIGDSALYNNGIGTTVTYEGSSNIALGTKALYNNTLGSYNTAIGNYSLYSNVESNNNNAFGLYSLYSNTTGNYNTAFGNNTMFSSTSGVANSAFGYQSAYNNLTGSNNVSVGNSSLLANNDSYNTAIGSSSMLYSNSPSNTAVGYNSLSNSNINGYNTAIGVNTMRLNYSGSNNCAMGQQALEVNTTGSYNVAIGSNSLNTNSDGYQNTAIGFQSLLNNTIGNGNTALGFFSLEINSSGSDNVAVGGAALFNNTTADKNVAVGRLALSSITNGSNNTAIGYNAGGSLNNGSVFNTTCIGYNTGWNTTTSNQINIGNHSVVSIGGEVNWGTYSDKRIKNNIQENVPGLAFISKLKPVTYNLDIHKQYELSMRGQKDTSGDFPGKYDIEKIKMTGFLAQDVEQAAKDCSYDFSGVEVPQNGEGLYKIRYAEFVVPLVKSVQELQTLLEVEKQKNLTLEARLKAIEEKLK